MALDQPQRGEDDQHRHQQTTIKKHWNGGAPSALEDGSGVAGRRQKKAVRCGHDDSLTWQRRGDEGAGSAPARRGRSASTLINNNQQVKQSWVVDRRQPNRTRGKVGARETTQGTTQRQGTTQGTTQEVNEDNYVR
jgi:hypothetical protein